MLVIGAPRILHLLNEQTNCTGAKSNTKKILQLASALKTTIEGVQLMIILTNYRIEVG